eukprot:TRINITY_DN337_c0_g3_i1.p1 TRINITY_DN337_c0_g3~~TRINITY_DN337_c0_g3_i1.p1  ORF type:complete len:626 (+),score=145.81 TRINITY_DN337_c0_g3_i1:100-1977(+)
MATPQIHNSTSLYVGDLASDISESHLYSIFSTVGLVSSIRVCRDALTRRSLGYAYVNYHNPYDASEALERFNNAPISQRPCRIMYSQRDPSLRRSGVGNIFIKNLNKSIDHKSLFDTFSTFGNILSCKIASDEHGNSKGFGFVQFETQEMADRAIEKVNSMMLMDKQVFVGKFIPKKERIRSRENQDFTNVYIKNLPESIDQKSFVDMFSGFGQINSSALMSHDKLKFGFVDFVNPSVARKTVAEMNGKLVGGQTIYVGRAQKKAERQAELKYKFQHELAQKYQGVNLYVKNLSDEVTDARLRQEFGQFGNITSAEVMKDEKGNSKGFGFVCFSSPEEATKAQIEMNNQIWDSKPIYVALAERKEARKAKLQALRQNKSHVFSGGPPIYPGPSSAGAPPQPVYYAGPPQSQQLAPQAFMYPQMLHQPRGGRQNYGNPQNQYSYPVNPNMSRGPRHHRGGQQGPPQYNNQRGGGRFHNSGPRGGGGHPRGESANSQADYQNQQNQQNAPQSPSQAPPPAQSSQAPEEAILDPSELTIDALEQVAKEERPSLIGEHLFPLVSKALVGKTSETDLDSLSGKITGMLLHNFQSGIDGPEELLTLVRDNEALEKKIAEALTVLDDHHPEQ